MFSEEFDDVTNPEAPRFVQYINNRDFAGNGDLAPEGVIFIDAHDAPGLFPLVVVANEETGTTTLYRVIPINRGWKISKSNCNVGPTWAGTLSS